MYDRTNGTLERVSQGAGGKQPDGDSQRPTLSADGRNLTYSYDAQSERTGITALLAELYRVGIRFRDLQTTQSSLEDIFVDLVRQSR